MTAKPPRHVRRNSALACVVLAAGVAFSACGQDETAPPPRQAPAGNPDRGAELIVDYGCGSCHTVPGIDTADGTVGPPLDRFSRRTYIAGNLPNSAENLRRWIRNPQRVEPGTAMPDLRVTSAEAADITAYLYTLD